MKRDGGGWDDDFWAAGVVDGGFVVVGFLAVVGLGAGMKPGGGDKGEDLGGGIKPTTCGRDAGLE